MKRIHVLSTAAVVLGAACLLQAQTSVPSNPLAGWVQQAELDQLVAKLRSGELKGPQTLFERTDGPYRVYTSFIDQRKGAADIHEAKATGPHEYRGTAIDGGVTRTVAAGDIVSVPRGTPHQMDATGGHVLYVVVKIAGSTGS